MMKRINLKNLRISSHQKESPQVSLEDEDEGAGEYEQPHSVGYDKDDFTESPKKSTHDGGDRTPGTPRRKEKRGFLRTLKRKFTTNFKGRKEVTSQIVDDDSSSETRYDDMCRGARGGYYSPRKPRPRSHRSESCEGTPGVSGRRRQPPPPTPEGLPHPTKEELSKSTEESSSTSPNEEDKVHFLADTEYGHASKPVCGSSVQPIVRATMSSMTGSSDTSTKTCSSSSGVHVSGDGSGTTWLDAMSSHPSDSGSTSLPFAPPPPCIGALQQGIEAAINPSQADFIEPKTGTWSLTKELFRLSKFGWYWGPITRVEAEEKLTNQPDGAFLVRDSSDERYLLSLSFRSYGRTLHTRIEHCNGVFSFYAQPETEGYTSIVDLIEHSMTDSQTGVFCYSRARAPGSPSFPVRLTKPVSRFTQVRSLQYLCRFVIRQYTRFDHIQKLPLPSSIREWLEENQY